MESLEVNFDIAEIVGVDAALVLDPIDRRTEAATRKLKEAGLITVENFNATRLDHTKWYALTEKAKKLIKSSTCHP